MSQSTKDQLVDSISRISERLYCAGWRDGIERDIWMWLNGPTAESPLTGEEASKLRRLIIGTAYWVEWSQESGEPVLVGIEEWMKNVGK